MNIQYRPEGLPEAHGLYDPRNEHDACGVGFLVDMKGRKSHRIVQQGLQGLRQELQQAHQERQVVDQQPDSGTLLPHHCVAPFHVQLAPIANASWRFQDWRLLVLFEPSAHCQRRDQRSHQTIQ